MPRKKLQTVGPHLILYDGVCGLCNRFTTFVLAHDRKAIFRFSSLQSATGQTYLRRFRKRPEILDTLYVVANYESESATSMERASAVLFVLKTLGRPWRWAGVFGILPDSLLNFGYDTLARVRYRIFGKYEQCVMPSAEERERFIDV